MARERLPQELEDRLQTIWRKVGHLLDWCQNSVAWSQMFCNEARPFRETFYWESVARMIADYQQEHPHASAEETLSDCLVATQCPASPDDRQALVEFRRRWEEILRNSRPQIDALIEADLQLAMQEGAYEHVAALYAADQQTWLRE